MDVWQMGMCGWTDVTTDEHVKGCVDRWTRGLTDMWIDVWTGGHVHGWMCEETDVGTDGRC